MNIYIYIYICMYMQFWGPRACAKRSTPGDLSELPIFLAAFDGV